MIRTNFTSLPNDFLLDEKKEHNATQLIKNATEKLIVIIFQGLQAKFGPNFQKSENELANMCLIARSTFNNNVENLINKGVITQTVVHKKGKKNNETSYWTLNLTFTFEEIENNEVGSNSVKVENDTTAPIENDTRVDSNSVKGCPNIGQLKELKELKELEEEENNNKYNNARFDFFFNLQENKGISNILDNKGFSHDTIMSIRKLCAEQKIHNELRPNIINLAVENYYKDKAKGLEIERPAHFFVYKLKEAAQQTLEKAYENEQREKAMLEQQQTAAKKLPFYNWLEA